MALYRTRLTDNLSSFNLITVDTTKKKTNVITCHSLIKLLTEHLDTGDNTEMEVDLIHPIAMEEGLRFAIREGGRTVGSGRVVKILE